MKPETHNEVKQGDISAEFDLTLDKIGDERRPDESVITRAVSRRLNYVRQFTNDYGNEQTAQWIIVG